MYLLGMEQCPLACELKGSRGGHWKGSEDTSGERLEELGLCILEKRKFKGHHIVVYKGFFC